MGKPTTEALKGAAAEVKVSAKAPTLYQAIEKAAEAALSRGDHAVYSTLHPVVVALAGAKFAASQAVHANVGDDAQELLDRIKAL